MSKRDYYEVLSVSQTATEIEIKKAFRRLAMKYHPDRNPDDQQAEIRFKEAREAYEVLSHPQKRSAYDQFGHEGLDQAMGAGGRAPEGFDFGDIFGNIFGDMFSGGQGQSSGRQSGSDLGYELSLSLEEAVHGIEKPLNIPTQITCETCEGQGIKPGSKPQSCQTCHGSGQVRMRHGFLEVQQTCSSCRGAGQIIKDPCMRCRGQGRIKRQKKLSVKIPAGVDTGDRIRLSGEGEAGFQGGRSGDLYVQIHVEPHPIFKRQNKDLHIDVPLYFITAILGGELEIPTLLGPVPLSIPAGTQTGQKFRLRGKGVKALRSGSVGDLICHVMVETPVKLSDEVKGLLRQVDELLEADGKAHSDRSRTWRDTVKEFFSSGKPS